MDIKSCKIIRSAARRTVGIFVHPLKGVYVRAPERVPLEFIHQFLEERRSWIQHQQNRLAARLSITDPGEGKDLEAHRAGAFTLLRQRVDFYARVLDIPSPRFSLGEPGSRWGSCNALGRIRFNWRIVLLPEALMDYVVVHELCHLIQLNHSDKFWNCVQRVLPDYLSRRQELRKFLPKQCSPGGKKEVDRL